MKRSVTFSLEEEKITKLADICNARGLNRNAVIETLLKEWLKDEETETIEIITCNICGAKYSSKLNVCPSCEEQKIKNKELFDQKIAETEKTRKIENITIDLMDLTRRKEYLERHLELGQAQQSEIDEVIKKIEAKQKELAEVKL